jgi:transcriptional regulator with GAF, ATPase, and Fis domain
VHPRTHDLALVGTTDGYVAPLRWIEAVWERQRARLAAGQVWRRGDNGVAPQLDEQTGVLRAVVFFEGAEEIALQGRFGQIAALLRERVHRMAFPDLRDFLLVEAEEPALDEAKAEKALAIRSALAVRRGNVARTAKALGLGRTTLYEHMRELGIVPALYRLRPAD